MVNLIQNYYAGKKVLVTGHTGFKGSWLSSALKLLGANVIGFSRGITKTSLISDTKEFKDHIKSYPGNVNDLNGLLNVVKNERPEIIFHLAAQPLVLTGYKLPFDTVFDNVVGTLNVCEIFRTIPTIKKAIIVTTDKVYKNQEFVWPYREIDPLGGTDPYSSSKAAADLIAQAYYYSFIDGKIDKQLFVMRGGNVIGGGDLSENRLVPDFFRALAANSELVIRHPDAVRPWQHVIDLVYAYLLVGQSQNKSNASCYNIGPNIDSNITVKTLLEKLKVFLRSNLEVRYERHDKEEAVLLSLDSSKFRNDFDWKPLIDIDTAIGLTCEWANLRASDHFSLAEHQLSRFLKKLS